MDVTSEGNPRDVITSSPMSCSMPHLGVDTIQPLNHIYRSSSVALTGCHGDIVDDDDDDVSMATRKVWTGRQGRRGVMTSRDCVVEQSQCYWPACRRQSVSTASSNSRLTFTQVLFPFHPRVYFVHKIYTKDMSVHHKGSLVSTISTMHVFLMFHVLTLELLLSNYFVNLLVCPSETGMCSRTTWSRPRPRPRPQNFILELSSRSRPVLEDPIPDQRTRRRARLLLGWATVCLSVC